MKKIHNLNDWQLDSSFPNDKRFVEARIFVSNIDIKTVLDSSPNDRKKKANAYRKSNFKQLIAANLFEKYELIGTVQKPYGVKAKITFTSLDLLNKLDFIWNVFIEKIDKAKKIKTKPKQNYYCVKMTVAIEIEGQTNGMQTIEERFVLIKAKSHEDAYNKLEKNKNNYSDPYLNASGQLVRWKIESFDGCYETDILSPEDLNHSEGMEVYSMLKTRRLTKDRIWDGNTE